MQLNSPLAPTFEPFMTGEAQGKGRKGGPQSWSSADVERKELSRQEIERRLLQSPNRRFRSESPT